MFLRKITKKWNVSLSLSLSFSLTQRDLYGMCVCLCILPKGNLFFILLSTKHISQRVVEREREKEARKNVAFGSQKNFCYKWNEQKKLWTINSTFFPSWNICKKFINVYVPIFTIKKERERGRHIFSTRVHFSPSQCARSVCGSPLWYFRERSTVIQLLNVPYVWCMWRRNMEKAEMSSLSWRKMHIIIIFLSRTL